MIPRISLDFTKLMGLLLVMTLVLTPVWQADAQDTTDTAFSVAVLGSGGGPREDNVSGYMVWPSGRTEEAVVFDPGVLTVGIREADARGNLDEFKVPEDSNLTREGWILQNIEAYLISHAHLDHTAAMIINSPNDSAKDIIGMPYTINHLQENIFNWEIWPNFGDAGQEPALGQYSYVQSQHEEVVQISDTELEVQTFELYHDAPNRSTAFLLKDEGQHLLFFGDTGPDSVEGTDNILNVWETVLPLVREDTLKAIFLEVSYPSDRPDEQLFGHLTPAYMMQELGKLANMVNPDDPESALEGLPIVVTSIKPTFQQGPTTREIVADELEEMNDLGVEFIIPEQGERYDF